MRFVGTLISALLIGCAATPPRVVVQQPSANLRQIHPFDVRFAQVDIDQMPIFDAVEALAAEVRRASSDESAFPCSFNPNNPFPGIGKRRVTFHGKNVSARNVLDEFCRQTNMTYHLNSKRFIEFQNGPVPPGFQPDIRRAKKLNEASVITPGSG